MGLFCLIFSNRKQKFTFFTDNDDDVKISIRNAGSAFKVKHTNEYLFSCIVVSAELFVQNLSRKCVYTSVHMSTFITSHVCIYHMNHSLVVVKRGISIELDLFQDSFASFLISVLFFFYAVVVV